MGPPESRAEGASKAHPFASTGLRRPTHPSPARPAHTRAPPRSSPGVATHARLPPRRRRASFPGCLAHCGPAEHLMLGACVRTTGLAFSLSGPRPTLVGGPA